MSQSALLPVVVRAWPGLPRLWFRGDASALSEALAFAAVFDLWVMSHFVWTGWLEDRTRWLLTALLIGWWGIGFWRNSRRDVLGTRKPDITPEQLLALWISARQAYLQCDWSAAEKQLRELLALAPRDPQAGLLLVRVLRRSGYLQESRVELGRLRKLDEAAGWIAEIDREEALIDQWLEDAQAQAAEEQAQMSGKGGAPVAESAADRQDDRSVKTMLSDEAASAAVEQAWSEVETTPAMLLFPTSADSAIETADSRRSPIPNEQQTTKIQTRRAA